MRPQLRRLLVRRARMHPYLVNHVLRTAMQRARLLDLRLQGQPAQGEARRARACSSASCCDMLLRDRENYAL